MLAILLAVWSVAVMRGAVAGFDAEVRNALHAHASPWLTGMARSLSLIGSNAAWVPATALVAALLCFARRGTYAFILLVTMSGAVLWENGLKLIFHRLRPESYFGLHLLTYSFPSGHALFATCFYGALAAIAARLVRSGGTRALILLVAIAMPIGIGVSRIYLGLHYPTDVIGGWLAGVTLLALLHAVGVFDARYFVRRKP